MSDASTAIRVELRAPNHKVLGSILVEPDSTLDEFKTAFATVTGNQTAKPMLRIFLNEESKHGEDVVLIDKVFGHLLAVVNGDASSIPPRYRPVPLLEQERQYCSAEFKVAFSDVAAPSSRLQPSSLHHQFRRPCKHHRYALM